MTDEVKEPEQQQQEEQKDPTEQLDITRKARLDALQDFAEILAHAEARPDKKISPKALSKAFASIRAYIVLSETLVEGMLRDTLNLAQQLGVERANMYSLGLHIQAIVKDLERKNITTTEALEKILREELIPEQMKVLEDQQKQMEQAEKVQQNSEVKET
jgi:hypothetical protein